MNKQNEEDKQGTILEKYQIFNEFCPQRLNEFYHFFLLIIITKFLLKFFML